MWTSFRELRALHGKDIKFISVTTPAPGDVIGLYTPGKDLHIGVINKVDKNGNSVQVGKKWVRTDREGYSVNFHRIVKPDETLT
jgi:hypothetical protein